MSVIERAEKRLQEEIRQNDLGADNGHLANAEQAADASEEFRKVNRELTEMYEDAVRKLPNKGEWIEVNPMVDSVQCSICGGQLFSAELETPFCHIAGRKWRRRNERY